jgi:hypothetical protein
MNCFATCSDPTGRERPKDRKDDQGRNDRMFQIGPDGLAAWAAHKIARVTGATEGGAYH